MLVWMDLEMTGLDPDRHVIVELATIVTDDQLGVVAEGPDLVLATPEEALAAMEEPVRTMHTTSGLLDAIRASSLSLAEAETATLGFIQAHVPEPGGAPLCGNSIGTDRRFLARYLPRLDAHLHYRSVDVSSIKELCRRWYPDAYRQAPRKAGGHRALEDVRESLAELAYYRRAIFRATEEPAPTTR
ncbi:MAG TPA: oligoribonuclease [Acidimicrobiales bacterium]|nr:oligoribonuclease [Acidimicrobiales bacterium]